jgi:hypothetical protein
MSQEDEAEEKLRVECGCGKAYRVSSKKAGKKITCKACGKKVRVPGERALSMSSRGDILRGLGIDPDASKKAWEEESNGKKGGGERLWKCSRCAAPLESGEIKGAYVQGELVCSVCRAGLEDRREAREGRKPLEKNEVAILSAPNPEEAKRQGTVIGVFIGIGFVLPLWIVVHLPLLVALLAGAAVGGAAGYAVYRSRS